MRRLLLAISKNAAIAGGPVFMGRTGQRRDAANVCRVHRLDFFAYCHPAVPVCIAQALMVHGFDLLSVAGFCLCARYLQLAERADGSTSSRHDRDRSRIPRPDVARRTASL